MDRFILYDIPSQVSTKILHDIKKDSEKGIEL